MTNGLASATESVALHGPSPREFIAGFIRDHEGGLSLDPVDSGNWTGGKRGLGALVGSKYGVTAAALALHRHIAPASITAQMMAALTVDEAVDIGFDLYFHAPRFDILPWNQVTASALDMGWGAGPGHAIDLLEVMIGVPGDGLIRPATAAAFSAYLAQHGLEATARAYGDARNAYYDRIIKARPADKKYEHGWKNRTASFLPGTPWWRQWS